MLERCQIASLRKFWLKGREGRSQKLKQVLYEVVLLVIRLLRFPIKPFNDGQEIVYLGPQLSMYRFFTLVFQLSQVHLRRELKSAGATSKHLIFDLISTLIDGLKDTSFEVNMIRLQRILQICTELRSLQNCEG